MPAGYAQAGNPPGNANSLTGVATNYNYVGSQKFNDMTIHEPEVEREIVRRYGRDDITGLLEMLGRTKGMGNRSVVNHLEKDFIHGVIKVEAYTTVASEKNVTLSIAGPSTFSYQQNVDPFGSTANLTSIPVQKYDILQIKGPKELIVIEAGNTPGTSLNANQIQVHTLDGSDVPSISADDEIVIKGTAIPEGSRQGLSRNSRFISYKNNMMRHRRDHKVTGTEYGEKSWILHRGKDGKVGPHWFLEALYDEYQRFMNEKEMLLFDGQTITDTDLQNLLPTVSKTLGMVETIRSSGINHGYNHSTGLTLADLAAMTKKLNKYKGSKENALVCGIEFREQFNRLFRQGDGADITGDGLARVQFQDFASLSAANAGTLMNLDFTGSKYLEYKFLIKQINTFSDSTTLGAAGQPYERMGLVIPMDNTVMYNDRNDSTKETVPSMRLVHKGDGAGGSRGYKEWVTGLGEGVANTDEDAFNVHMLTEMLLQMFAINRYGIFFDTSA